MVRCGYVLEGKKASTLSVPMVSQLLSLQFRCGLVVLLQTLVSAFITESGLFSIWRLQAKTKVHEYTAHDFLFTNMFALNASTQSDMQGSIDLFSKSCDDFGFTIFTEETEVLHQLAPAAPLHWTWHYRV